MKKRSRITTQAYFVSRMRDNGYIVDRLYSQYAQHDPRVWTVVVDPRGASVFITCMRNVDGIGEDYFEIYDAGQFTPQRFKIVTDSVEVIITKLNEFGIIRKSPEYVEGGPKRLRDAASIKSE